VTDCSTFLQLQWGIMLSSMVCSRVGGTASVEVDDEGDERMSDYGVVVQEDR